MVPGEEIPKFISVHAVLLLEHTMRVQLIDPQSTNIVEIFGVKQRVPTFKIINLGLN